MNEMRAKWRGVNKSVSVSKKAVLFWRRARVVICFCNGFRSMSVLKCRSGAMVSFVHDFEVFTVNDVFKKYACLATLELFVQFSVFLRCSFFPGSKQT